MTRFLFLFQQAPHRVMVGQTDGTVYFALDYPEVFVCHDMVNAEIEKVPVVGKAGAKPFFCIGIL